MWPVSPKPRAWCATPAGRDTTKALALTLIDGVTGLLFSASVVIGVDAIPNTDGAMQYLANPNLSWPIALTCAGVLVLIGLAAGVLPARRAARIDPVEALRYE